MCSRRGVERALITGYRETRHDQPPGHETTSPVLRIFNRFPFLAYLPGLGRLETELIIQESAAQEAYAEGKKIAQKQNWKEWDLPEIVATNMIDAYYNCPTNFEFVTQEGEGLGITLGDLKGELSEDEFVFWWGQGSNSKYYKRLVKKDPQKAEWYTNVRRAISWAGAIRSAGGNVRETMDRATQS